MYFGRPGGQMVSVSASQCRSAWLDSFCLEDIKATPSCHRYHFIDLNKSLSVLVIKIHEVSNCFLSCPSTLQCEIVMDWAAPPQPATKINWKVTFFCCCCTVTFLWTPWHTALWFPFLDFISPKINSLIANPQVHFTKVTIAQSFSWLKNLLSTLSQGQISEITLDVPSFVHIKAQRSYLAQRSRE